MYVAFIFQKTPKNNKVTEFISKIYWNHVLLNRRKVWKTYCSGKQLMVLYLWYTSGAKTKEGETKSRESIIATCKTKNSDLYLYFLERTKKSVWFSLRKSFIFYLTLSLYGVYVLLVKRW